MKQVLILSIITTLLLLVGCRKDENISSDSNLSLSFSTDSVQFDTVFTSLGSTTKRFKIYNRNSSGLVISSIRLKNGTSSFFRMNVDGVPGKQIRNIKIPAKDSLFVFVEVTIDPSQESNPFVINEEIEFVTNTNVQTIQLEAWGQNAYYYRPTKFLRGLPPLSELSEYSNYFPITDNIILPNDKPHVIYGYLVIDSNIVLNVQPNTKFHLYNEAGIWAYRGSTLKVNGKLDEEVVFQGIRLEDSYDDIPGQWDRIILNESPNNHVFNHAIIKNSFIGISPEFFYLDGTFGLSPNKLILKNSIVQQSKFAGIFSRSYNIEAVNCVFANAEYSPLFIQGGGKINLKHCTVGNYWNFGARKQAAVYFKNSFQLGQTEVVGDLDIYVGNSIIYGTNEEEIEYEVASSGSLKPRFENCIIRTQRTNLDNDTFNTITSAALFGSVNFFNPLFNDVSSLDFSLHNEAISAIDKANPTISDTIKTDILLKQRDSNPDIGAYELEK